MNRLSWDDTPRIEEGGTHGVRRPAARAAGVRPVLLFVALVAALALCGCSFSEDVVAPVEKLFEPPPPEKAIRVMLLPDDADQESLPSASSSFQSMYRAARDAMKGHGLVLGGPADLPHNIKITGREATNEKAVMDVSKVRVWDYIIQVSYYPLLSFPTGYVDVRAEGKIHITPVQWKGPTIPVRFTSTTSRDVGAHPDKSDILDAVDDMSERIGKDVGEELSRRVQKLAELHPPLRGVNATGLAYDGRLPDAWQLVRSFRPYATFVPIISQPVRDQMRKNLGVKRLEPGSAKKAKAGKAPQAGQPKAGGQSGGQPGGSSGQGGSSSSDPGAVDTLEKANEVPAPSHDPRDVM